MLTSVKNIRLSNMLSRFLRSALLVSAVSTPMFAQLAPSPGAPPSSTAPDTEDTNRDAPLETLKVNVNLVSLYFTVHDKRNALIPNLTGDDCTVFEDKMPQKLKNFSAEADQPLTLGIHVRPLLRAPWSCSREAASTGTRTSPPRLSPGRRSSSTVDPQTGSGTRWNGG